MTTFLKILCVGVGGGIGAASRHFLVELLGGTVGLPTYVAVMIVNLLGCFLIGFVFVVLEGRYRRDGTSRLRHLPVSDKLADRHWWPEGDPTLSAADLFRMNLNVELLGAFFMTGILGSMTTFSLFSLLSFEAWQAGDAISAAMNAIGSVALGYFAVVLGLGAGHRWVPPGDS